MSNKHHPGSDDPNLVPQANPRPRTTLRDRGIALRPPYPPMTGAGVWAPGFHLVLVGVALIAAVLIGARPLWLLFVATLSLLLHLLLHAKPFIFYEEWLLADIAVPPSTRLSWDGFFTRLLRLPLLTGTLLSSSIRLLLQWVLGNESQSLNDKVRTQRIELEHHLATALKHLQSLFALVALIIFTGLLFPKSFSLILLIISLTLFLIWRLRQVLPVILSRARHVRHLYLEHPDVPAEHRGLWAPTETFWRRQLTYTVLVLPLLLIVPAAFAEPARTFGFLLSLVGIVLLQELVLLVVFLPDLELLNAVAMKTNAAAANGRTLWEQIIARKDRSESLTDREGIFLGVEAHTWNPIVVPRAVLYGHAHVRGGTGSGKTAGTLVPLIRQLIAPYEEQRNGVVFDRRDPVLIIDLGGDQAMFHAAKECAEQHGRTFRFLSVQTGHAFHYFDPLQALRDESARDTELANLFVDAFNLDYGLIYGAQYFTQQNLESMMEALRLFRQQQGRDGTLADLRQLLLNNRTRPMFRNAEQIDMCVNFLTPFPQLDWAERHRALGEIHCPTVLEESEVVYFYLPTLGETVFVRQIAGLALYSHLAACKLRQGSGRNSAQPRQLWVVIDEFQELVGKSIGSLLSQSRKFGMSLFLSNQSTAQLNNRDIKLAEIIENDTSVRQYVTVTAEDIESLQMLSGDEVRIRESISTSNNGATTVTRTPFEEPALPLNEILETSGTQRDAFLLVKDESTLGTPTRITTFFSTTAERYFELRNRPLPKEEKPKAASEGRKTAPATDHPKASERDALVAARNEAMRKIWERYAKQRQPPSQAP